MAERRDVTFRIVHEIGVIRVNPVTGWRKELNIVSWNGREARYDIRDWNEDRTHMSKGIQLAESDIKNLITLYQGYTGREPAEGSTDGHPQFAADIENDESSSEIRGRGA